ncbi:MAG: hypothetical protein PUC21_04225 [Bacteroidales bacterium]|nr:hypothetical protein [Bacteroidales bacterium]
MKQISLLLLLLIGITLTSCGEKEDFSSYDLKTFIIGEWSWDATNQKDYTFYSNGKGLKHYPSGDEEFTWTLTNNTLSVFFGEGNTSMNRAGEVKILGRNKMEWGYLKYTRIGDYNDSLDNDTSNPGDKEDNSGYAPESLKGKIIRFDEWLADGGGGTGNDNRIQFYTEHDMRASWATESSSYTYTKTGKNTGDLNFICGYNSYLITRVFRYNVRLTFTDSNGNFELEGTKEITGGLSGNGTYLIKGKGSYWSKLWD